METRTGMGWTRLDTQTYSDQRLFWLCRELDSNDIVWAYDNGQLSVLPSDLEKARRIATPISALDNDDVVFGQVLGNGAWWIEEVSPWVATASSGIALFSAWYAMNVGSEMWPVIPNVRRVGSFMNGIAKINNRSDKLAVEVAEHLFISLSGSSDELCLNFFDLWGSRLNMNFARAIKDIDSRPKSDLIVDAMAHKRSSGVINFTSTS
jgi:hypothetical protein